MAHIVVTADLHYLPQWHEALEAFAGPASTIANTCGGPSWSGAPGGTATIGWHRELQDRRTRHLRHAGLVRLLGQRRVAGVRRRDYALQKGRVNNDARCLDWPWGDREFAAELLAGFEQRLGALAADSGVRDTLVVTHVPPFEANMLRKPGDFAWNFSNAYFGNFTLGRAIAACPKVSHVVSGHTHVGASWRAPGAAGEILSSVVDSDYGRPATVELNLDANQL